MLSSIYKNLHNRFWFTQIYSADLLLSISMIFLGAVMYQFVPGSEPCLFNISKIIDGNQFPIATTLIFVGLLQLLHVHSGHERRKYALLFHTISLFLSFSVWLTFTVSSIYNATTIPIATASYAALCVTSLWCFIRYGDRTRC